MHRNAYRSAQTQSPQLRPNRGLIAQVAGLLAAGAAVGIMANELGMPRRVSYFGFQKRKILEARLARSIREAEAQGLSPAAAEPLEVIFFFTECVGLELSHSLSLRIRWDNTSASLRDVPNESWAATKEETDGDR